MFQHRSGISLKSLLHHPRRARPDEAVSWGKVRLDAKPVKVYGEATLLLPLLVAETFARRHHKVDAAAAVDAADAKGEAAK